MSSLSQAPPPEETAPAVAPSVVSTEPTVEPRRQPIPIRWQSRPATDEPAATLILLAAIVATAVIMLLATGSTWLAVGAALILALTTLRHWTTTVYETGREALRIETAAGLGRLRWSAVDRWYEGERGVWLVTPHRPMPWDYLGGLYCPWPHDREALRQALTYNLGHAAGRVSREASDGQQPAPGTRR